MRPPPSENLRSAASTFHSRSEGGFFCGLLKKTSYSIFSRRRCDSSIFISSSMVMPAPFESVSGEQTLGEVPSGHDGDRTKVSKVWLLAVRHWLFAFSNRLSLWPLAFLLHRHLLHHRYHQLAVAIVQTTGVAANLGEKAKFVVRKLGERLRSIVVAGFGEEVRKRQLHRAGNFRECIERRHGVPIFNS